MITVSQGHAAVMLLFSGGQRASRFTDRDRRHFGHILMCLKSRGIQRLGGWNTPREWDGSLSGSDASPVRKRIDRCPFFMRLNTARLDCIL